MYIYKKCQQRNKNEERYTHTIVLFNFEILFLTSEGIRIFLSFNRKAYCTYYK
jgi:hypothetical protein